MRFEGVNWEEYFEYVEELPTKLRWKHPRIGRNGVPTKRINGGMAGYFDKNGVAKVGFKRTPTLCKFIIWELFNEKLKKSDEILFKDGDPRNLSIDNLELRAKNDCANPYGSYLSEYLYYDETSPSFLRWKKKTSLSSVVSEGDVAGNFDTSNGDGYWRVVVSGRILRAHKIVWAMFNNYEDQTGLFVEHIDGNTQNNRPENLRLVRPEINSRNASMQRGSITGVNGVSFRETKLKDGTKGGMYIAVIREEGKRRSRAFSTLKYGEELALLLATEWRDKEVKLLNMKGYGYTDRHGT